MSGSLIESEKKMFYLLFRVAKPKEKDDDDDDVRVKGSNCARSALRCGGTRRLLMPKYIK